jgi:hypothetical protein
MEGTATGIVGWPCAEYDSIVASAACERFDHGPGVNSMMAVLLIAGIGCVLAGLLAIGFGIPVKEFSFGNTLILTGVIGACTGMIMLGLWTVVRELKNIARRFGPGFHAEESEEGTVALAARGNQAPEGPSFLFGRDQPPAENPGPAGPTAQPSAPSPRPRHEAGSRDRGRRDVPAEPAEATPALKARRNLLFSSSSRNERERARTAEPSASDLRPAPAASPSESSEAPAPFEDTWPKSERPRPLDGPLQRRRSRPPSTFTENNAGGAAAHRDPPAAPEEDQSAVTVLKSGVVDGMAYSLYSDGSIEAQMPEGMMRFASIDELRSHLDQRP